MIKTNSDNHYDLSYFAWQSPSGELSAAFDIWKFSDFVRPNDVVLDFGCGGGYLLQSLSCRDRYGIEINAAARAEAEKKMIHVFPDVESLPADMLFDVIISHHALEHVKNPIDVLCELRRKLKPQGSAVFVVPSESWIMQRTYVSGDINQHLFTWTPLSLGNAFREAGFQVEDSKLLCHRWLPGMAQLRSFLPSGVLHRFCEAWAFLTFNRQVRVVARATT